MLKDNHEKRKKSPNFPALALPDALEKAERIYNAESTHAGDSDTLSKAMGYTNLKSGTAIVALSALKKYELLVPVDNEKYKLSEFAIDIIIPQSTSGKATAIKQTAFKPTLFAELYEEFKLALPSDNNLRNRLIKRGFIGSGLDNVIKAILATWEFVKQECETLNQESSTVNESAYQSTPQEKDLFSANQLQSSPDSQDKEVLNFRISRDSHVQIIFDGIITQEAIEKLRKLLELSIEDYPRIEELNQK